MTGSRVPLTAWLCAVVALVNAAAWSLVVPPFHVPDETNHFAYAQYLAETGEPPNSNRRGAASEEQEEILGALGFGATVGQYRHKPNWTAAQEEGLRMREAEDHDPVGDGGYTSASNNPPLYYALTAVPYLLTPGGDLVDRLFLMRLLSVLMAGGTVLLTFLFLRELLPRTPWAWPAGALAVAFQPLFLDIAAGTTPDNLMILAASALFYLLALSFRSGLTRSRGIAIGLVTVAGLLAKATFIAFLPGVALALGFLLWRARAQPRPALTAAGLAAGCVLGPVLVYALVNGVIWDRPLWGGGVGSVAGSVTGAEDPGDPTRGLFREQVSYFWQLYLPRLPWMNDQFSYAPFWDTFFHGFVGQFGWLDYDFPGWVYRWAKWVLGLIAALAVIQLILMRGRLRHRIDELVAYVAIMLGLLALIAVAGYQAKLDDYQYVYEQARYLLPLLPLYGAVVAIAVRCGGRRLGPVLAAAVVVIAAVHGLGGFVATIDRYYL